MRDSFVFYRSFANAIRKLDEKDQIKLYNAIIDYALDGKKPKINKVLLGMFELVKPQIDTNNKRYENGKRGGRPTAENIENKSIEKNKKTKQKPNETKQKPKQSNLKPNVNVNVNDNVNVNEKERKKREKADTNHDGLLPEDYSLSLSLVSHLNLSAGTSYRTDDPETVRLVADLTRNGYTEDQIKTVIDKKCADWLGDSKVEQYLRPKTLFSLKNFDGYLNAPASARRKQIEQQKQQEQNQIEVQADIEKLTGELDEVTNELNNTTWQKNEQSQKRRRYLIDQRELLTIKINSLER